jgi:hypothetical protein
VCNIIKTSAYRWVSELQYQVPDDVEQTFVWGADEVARDVINTSGTPKVWDLYLAVRQHCLVRPRDNRVH